MDFFKVCGAHPCNFFDWVSAIASIAGLFAIIWGIFKYFREIEAAEQRQKDEFEWRKIAESRAFLKQIRDSDTIQAAFRLVDYEATDYEFNNQKIRISRTDRDHSLRTMNLGAVTDKDEFVRGCFDDLFEILGEAGNLTRTDHLREEVLIPTLGYYSSRMVKQADALQAYAENYGFEASWKTIVRLDCLNRNASKKSFVAN